MTDWNQLQKALDAANAYLHDSINADEFSVASWHKKQRELGRKLTYRTANIILDQMVEDGVYKKRKVKLETKRLGWAYSLKK